ncbi:putative Delta(5) fatty acid desaturase C [Colletotrichum tanaceti]|nr:putative Delta(5) fatty acid desaturase C [Colletotrichum tanaceti]
MGMRGMSPQTCEGSLHWTYDNWSAGDPFVDVPLGIPAVLPCATATADFWESHVQKYGASSLRTSWVCEGRSELRQETMHVWPAKIMSEPYKYSGYAELDKSMKSVAQMLRKRRLDLKRLRPWYHGEYFFWHQTVYAHSMRRFTMSWMAASFRSRSAKHEAEARDSIDTLIKPHSPSSDLEKAGPDPLAPQMFFQAFGFLALAALPVRTSPLRYQDESIGEYPDRISQGLRPGFAGDKNLLEWLVKHGRRVLASKRSKTQQHGAQSPSHDRELCMSNAGLAFRRWEALGFVAGAILCQFETELQIMRRRLDQAPLDDAFLDWDSTSWRVLPCYQGPAGHSIPVFFRQEKKGARQSEGVDADIPAWAIARPAMVAASASTTPTAPATAPARTRPTGTRIPYYTVGEVGDHQVVGAARVWGCVFDGREMAIYDITDLLVDRDGDVLEWNYATMAAFTRPGPVPGAPRVIDPAVLGLEGSRLLCSSGNRFIGNVMMHRASEDVKINDGKFGRPRWAALADSVFDITEVGFDDDLLELEEIFAFTCTIDKDPVREAINRGYHPDVIKKALRPYKIGTLWDKTVTRQFRDRAFTANDVKWHTSRETGIYSIIGRLVYDFTDLIDNHPGGSEMIARVAGGDATELWEKHHGNPISKSSVNFDKYRDMRCIGHVVEERETKALSLDEICIRDYIFSKNSVKADSPILKSLANLWGTDGTAELEKQTPNKAYLDLWDCTEYIVAKVVKPLDRLPYMSREVLREMDGRSRPEGFNELYVSDGKYVYNLTSLVAYHELDDPWLQVLKRKAGSVLSAGVPGEDEVRKWLWDTSRHRIIGLYRNSPKHSLSTAEIPVAAWKTSPRRTPSVTPKVVPGRGDGDDPSEDATKKKTRAQVALCPPMGAPAAPTTPFTVRPLCPLRKKQKRSGAYATPGPPSPGPSLPTPCDPAPGSPMDVSQSIAMTALEEMGFAMRPGTETGGVRKRKMGDWVACTIETSADMSIPKQGWAKHYCVGKPRPRRSDGLSWIDPVFPAIDPVTLRLDDPSPARIPQPPPERLDDLYTSEAQQTNKLFGMRTWEAAVLAEADVYAAANEAPWIAGTAGAAGTGDAGSVVVREWTWFPFWARDRWVIDFTVPPNWSNTWTTAHLWSAQDPAVWAVLREAIQIADNMLRCCLLTPWFQSVVNPANYESGWKEVPLGSGQMGKLWWMRNPPVQLLTAEDTVKRLLRVLGRRVFWTFNDKARQANYEPDGITHGLTVPVKGFVTGPIAIFIDVLELRTLLDPMTTGRSRKSALANVADTVRTIVHELMDGRSCLPPPVARYRLLTTNAQHTQFGPNENQSELGHSWETDTFGGKFSTVVTEESAEYFHTTTGAGLIIGLTEWPLYWDCHQWTFDQPRDFTAAFTKWPVPGLWTQSLSSQAFWECVVGRFGAACLRAPKMLYATLVLGDDGYPVPLTYPRDKTTRWVADFAPAQHHAASLRSLARELHARRQKHARLRPWYVDTFAMWQLTPWNGRRYREDLAWLRDVGFVRRNDRQEANAQGIVQRWTHPFKMGTNPDGSLGVWASRSHYGNVPREVGITVWFWRALGYLLYAALPARLPKTTPVKKPRGAQATHWTLNPAVPLTAEQRRDAEDTIQAAEAARWEYPAIWLLGRHKTLDTPSAVRRARLEAVQLARDTYDIFESLCVRPAGLRRAFEAACDAMQVRIEADRPANYASWLDFDFDMPPYPGKTEDGQALGIMEFWAAGKLWKQPPGIGYEDPSGEVLRGEDPTISMQTCAGLPAFAMRGLAGEAYASSRPGGRRNRHRDRSRPRAMMPYFTLAELHDHAERFGEPLVLVEDGLDLEVYRRSAVSRALGVARDEVLALTRRTFYGRQLTREATRRLFEVEEEEEEDEKEEGHPALAIGRVVRVLREEDVALSDGRDGRPLWIRMHRSVFDVTDLKCVSEPKLTELLRSVPGGDPSRNLRGQGYSLAEVRKSLAIWRIGILAAAAGSGAVADRHSVRTFTPKMLRGHEFREVGMYVAIDGRVYDITNYVDLHPGGLQVLVENAGRDVTALFDRYHRENRDLIVSRLQELYIGNLVEQRQQFQDDELQGTANRDLVRPHEIMIDRSVYSVQALRESDEYEEYRGLVEQLSPYLGTDATQDLKVEDDDNDEAPLLRLARLRAYIVATVARIGQGLPEMEHNELQMFDGQADEVKDVRNDSFVASDDMVYDLTAAVRFGSANPNYAKFEPFLGGIVTDRGLKSYLVSHCQDLICAVLVKKKRPGGGGRGRVVEWDPRRPAPRSFKMPIWTDQPKKKTKRPPPADDEVAPYPSAIRKAQRAMGDEDFEREDIFRPPPSRSDLDDLMASIKHGARPEFGGAPGRPRSGLSGGALSCVPRPTPGQLQRPTSELRRRALEKRASGRRRRVSGSHSMTGLAAVTTRQEKPPTGDIAGAREEPQTSAAEGDGARAVRDSPGEPRRTALEVLPKRKLLFRADDGPSRKKR